VLQQLLLLLLLLLLVMVLLSTRMVLRKGRASCTVCLIDGVASCSGLVLVAKRQEYGRTPVGGRKSGGRRRLTQLVCYECVERVEMSVGSFS